jgi:peptidoglycan-associated lipoprotein
MITLRTTRCVPALALAVLAAGCGTSTDLTQTKAPVETRRPGGTPAAANATSPAAVPQSRVATVDTAAPAAAATAAPALALPNQRIVYFDFDSFVIKDEFKPMIEGHAKALAALRTKKLTIEGHTDERGGSEYNLALGQKRAESVARTLALLGAGQAQIEAVSFGKERPADPGHGEAAWAKNRRAELKDR